MNAKIEVDNLKCSGCTNTIKKELQLMEGVTSVAVDNETALVEVTCRDEDIFYKVKIKLADLGYPEANTTHGINKLAAHAKSYISCAIGKIS